MTWMGFCPELFSFLALIQSVRIILATQLFDNIWTSVLNSWAVSLVLPTSREGSTTLHLTPRYTFVILVSVWHYATILELNLPSGLSEEIQNFIARPSSVVYIVQFVPSYLRTPPFVPNQRFPTESNALAWTVLYAFI